MVPDAQTIWVQLAFKMASMRAQNVEPKGINSPISNIKTPPKTLKILPNPSPQSLSPSQRNDPGMQRPVEHWKSVALQVGVVQFWFSSELSRQSSSPSQTQVLGIQRWLSQVKSQELGQAGTAGSADGSEAQLFPSALSFSPYGQPHLAEIPISVELSGIGKHNFWQLPFFSWHGCLSTIRWASLE